MFSPFFPQDKEEEKLYILASDFFEKDYKYVFKARNSCCMQEIFSINI